MNKNTMNMVPPSNTLKVYTGKPLEGVLVLPIFHTHFDIAARPSKRLFRGIFDEVSFSFLEIVDRPDDADVLCIPHDYFRINIRKEYLEGFVRDAQRLGKKIITIVYGDTHEPVDMPHTLVLRTSGYRHRLASNEIIMPPYVEDLAGDGDIVLRQKGEVPIVGFCGWAGFSRAKDALRFWVRVRAAMVHARLSRDQRALVYIQGIYFRKKVLAVLRQSSLIKANFVVRSSYSGHKNTIELPPEQARAQYIENMIGSDFVVCAKGDGNWSYRFFETLALGRLPVFIDTESPLPLEGIISYDDIMVRVPWDDLTSAPARIRAFYDGLSPEEYGERQRRARKIFEDYLRIDRFLALVFSSIAEGRPPMGV